MKLANYQFFFNEIFLIGKIDKIAETKTSLEVHIEVENSSKVKELLDGAKEILENPKYVEQKRNNSPKLIFTVNPKIPPSPYKKPGCFLWNNIIYKGI